jgi:hypothetical protein
MCVNQQKKRKGAGGDEMGAEGVKFGFKGF